jgi:hypothetical protein
MPPADSRESNSAVSLVKLSTRSAWMEPVAGPEYRVLRTYVASPVEAV